MVVAKWLRAPSPKRGPLHRTDRVEEMIANARMYSVDAVSAAAWRALLEWVMKRSGVASEVIDYPPPQRLEALWSRPDLGCAFMCGYPLVRATPQPIVLAAPVPSPNRYGGRPVYWSDLVVRDDSKLETVADILGRRFAYTTEDSQSGYHAARRFLAPYARARGLPLFASTVGPLVTPRNLVEAIVAGEADAGPLDSYAHDLLRLHEPALATRLRTIASTAPTAIPPLVAAATIPAGDARRLTDALLAVEHAAELTWARAALLLQRFERVTAESYDTLQVRAKEADALGYARLL